jgi:hypothetical protein
MNADLFLRRINSDILGFTGNGILSTCLHVVVKDDEKRA